MSVEANKAVVKATLAALAAADFDTMLSYLDDDIVFYVIGSTAFSGTITGKQALLDEVLVPMAAERNEEGYSEELLQIIGEDDVVVTESRGNKTTRSGQQYNNEYAFFYQFRNGKICQWRCYLDTQLLQSTHGNIKNQTS